jgi:pyridoxamine 5'-phosphate oxidase
MSDVFEELSAKIAHLEARRYAGDVAPLPDEETLDRDDLDPDPFLQFAGWLGQAIDAHPGWPNAVTVATADAGGRPSARTVLLKSIDRDGFTFFTNYGSRKGRELTANPHAALVFYWPLLGRQVCVRGSVARTSNEESESYFRSRPYGSQIGAWASEQSSVVADRAALDERASRYKEEFGDEVPRPDHWGGFRLTPDTFEFWKSRRNRLHDRFLYERAGKGWSIARLAP